MLVITESIFRYAHESVALIKIPAIRCLLEQRDYYLKYNQFEERTEMEAFLNDCYGLQLLGAVNGDKTIAFCLALKDYYRLSDDDVGKLLMKACKKKLPLGL